MKDFIKRLSSRKFLLAVAASLVFYTNKQYAELAATILAYLGVEGGADIVRGYANNKYAVPATIDQQTQLINSGDLELNNVPKVIVPGQA